MQYTTPSQSLQYCMNLLFTAEYSFHSILLPFSFPNLNSIQTLALRPELLHLAGDDSCQHTTEYALQYQSNDPIALD
jgi:hypothetical protein